eukprot:17499-Prymnesium_polylepis.1
MGDEGMKSFSTALASGAMAKVTLLNLGANKIGDEGMWPGSSCANSSCMPLSASCVSRFAAWLQDGFWQMGKDM